ncbi:TPA: hypothetical protein NII73_004100 [Pseudomonas aeruginosa]|nr:hypothetical protein [Pseudomonas aeruginosa]
MSRASKDEHAPSAGSPLAIIERVWELTWATRIICIGLCLDTALVCYPGGGLLAWAAGEQPTLTLGWYAAALTIFCALVGYAIPIVFFFWRRLAQEIFGDSSEPHRMGRSRTMVSEIELLDDALRGQSQFVLDYYERNQRARTARLAQANLLAMVVVFILGNLIVGWLFAGAPTLVYAFAAWAGKPALILLILMLCFFFFHATSIWLKEESHTIYYPPLAENLEEQFRENLARKHELESRF